MNLPYINLIPASERFAFQNKLIQISNALGVNPVWFMIMFYSESGLKPGVINYLGCVGLIQLCPSGGLNLFGLSAQQIANMSATQQLDLVYKYFKPYAGKIKSLKDLYLINFMPGDFAYRNNPSYILGSKSGLSPALVAQHNKLFDLNKDNQITMLEFETYLNKKFGSVLKQYNAQAKGNFDFQDIAYILLAVELIEPGFIDTLLDF